MEHIFLTRNMHTKKQDILSEKRDAAKKSVSLCPKAAMLTPMQVVTPVRKLND